MRRVDLGALYTIEVVSIYIRTDPCCIDRLHDVVVNLSSDIDPQTSEYYLCGEYARAVILSLKKLFRYFFLHFLIIS